ncbi:hypothetical protein EV363DRAFT_1404986 [Boletus edulis]|nr:hypothetical protein EV363DRAFT_1404986 [Boletus edulis]
MAGIIDWPSVERWMTDEGRKSVGRLPLSSRHVDCPPSIHDLPKAVHCVDKLQIDPRWTGTWTSHQFVNVDPSSFKLEVCVGPQQVHAVFLQLGIKKAWIPDDKEPALYLARVIHNPPNLNR